MTVRIVTDSTADLPADLAAELGITVVPLTVIFGDEALEDGTAITAGGRVLNVSACGRDFREARERAYAAVEMISFKDSYYRGDIALRVSGQGDLGA